VEDYERCHPIGSTARLALAILLYTSQRRADVILFGRTKGLVAIYAAEELKP
jgi:hypothetical protein